MKSDRYIFIFALIICLACSLLLSVTAALLRNRQELNVELDRKMNILKALGEADSSLSKSDVQNYFNNKISEISIDPASGDIVEPQPGTLPLYQWQEGGVITKYAFPISGKGLWSTIYGYLALEQDADTMLGITFYKHGETPGLGGEIEKDWFQQQFPGKKLTKNGQLVTFKVLKGKVADHYPAGNDHAVDGISGATMTCKGLNVFINNDIKAYDKYFSKQRKAGK